MAVFRSVAEHRCWAEIDLDALRHNLDVLRRRIGDSVRVLAVVKADAYGHGISEIVHGLSGRVEMFGVADLNEAMTLRRWVPAGRVLLLSPALPSERAEIVRRGFVPTVSSLEEARAFGQLWEKETKLSSDAVTAREAFSVHVDIDTGMGRIGIPERTAVSVVKKIAALPGIMVSGISTHLPSADEDEVFTRAQLQAFASRLQKIRDSGLHVPVAHALHSAGAIGYSSEAHGMVRAGLMLYGCSPFPEFQPQLQPVMAFKTRVTLVRSVGPERGISYGRTFVTDRAMKIATLAVGYGDGYVRHLSGSGAAVLIRGKRCPLLGRVTMDQIMVDVSRIREVAPGEEVVLFGHQMGNEILVSEIAERAGTIPWEIFTGISPRVRRVYRQKPMKLDPR